MFRPTCRPSSGVTDKITTNGSVTDYPSVDPPSPDYTSVTFPIPFWHEDANISDKA
jgi:hypothetical protein